jgi:hypothetical protein
MSEQENVGQADNEQEQVQGTDTRDQEGREEEQGTEQEQSPEGDATEQEPEKSEEEKAKEAEKAAEAAKREQERNRVTAIHNLAVTHLNMRATTYKWPFPATERYLEVLHDAEFISVFTKGVQGGDEDLSNEDFIIRLNAFNESGRMPKTLDIAKNLGTEKLRKEISKKPNDVLWLRGLVAVALAELEYQQANEAEDAEPPTEEEVRDETTDETPQEIEAAAQEEQSAA